MKLFRLVFSDGYEYVVAQDYGEAERRFKSYYTYETPTEILLVDKNIIVNDREDKNG